MVFVRYSIVVSTDSMVFVRYSILYVASAVGSAAPHCVRAHTVCRCPPLASVPTRASTGTGRAGTGNCAGTAVGSC
eukprot:108426-Prymnesium_polylepis.1